MTTITEKQRQAVEALEAHAGKACALVVSHWVLHVVLRVLVA